MDIVLATLNAKYIHCALGLRCLRANLGELRERSVIRELTIQERPVDIVESLLAERPRVIGLGVYVWNAAQSLSVVRLLKQLAPDVRVLLGGPEVSHETDSQEMVRLADHVILGEGEDAFARLAGALLRGENAPKLVPGGLPELARLKLPFDEYSDEDIAHRVLYIEASRGCPFSCEFCLSALDTRVRGFPLERLLPSLDALIARGARQLKFVDRTFNLSPRTSHAILDFLLERPDVFAHFEMIPDRLPAGLKERLARFKPGMIQLEIGIQTFEEEVAQRISRTQDNARVDENLRWLRASTGAHLHTDLIVGLPGESIEQFGAGFDRLVALEPHEIQVGILKRLRGAPIARHDADAQAVWSAEPPYELLENRWLAFEQLQRLKRFARAWDLISNRGNFLEAAPLLWRGRSPFAAMLELTDWLSARTVLTSISLPRLSRLLIEFLVERRGLSHEDAARAVARDYAQPGRPIPAALKPFVGSSVPARQQRHQRARSAAGDEPHHVGERGE